MKIDVARLEEIERERQREEHIELTLQKVRNKNLDKDNIHLTNDEWDIVRQESLSNKKCAICGEKLHTTCFAEDSFSVECVNCDILFYED
jgi:hypothetical protein